MDSLTYRDEEMVSVEETSVRGSVSLGVRQRGNNTQYLESHIHDHTYFTLPVPSEEITPDIVLEPEYEPHQPPQGVPVHMPDFLDISEEFKYDLVVMGNKNTLYELLDYIDIIKEEEIGGELPHCEGVILSKKLQLEAPGNYRENYNYNTTHTLGTGTFGSVTHCQDVNKGTIFACKRVTIDSFRRQEVEVLVALMDSTKSSRCLPEIYAVILDGNFVKILMEYVDLSWTKLLQTYVIEYRISIDELMMINLLKQALCGLQHLQLHKISHCDIKPDNLGYNKNTQEVKFLDFGTVRLSTQEFTHKGMTGHYMAPEACCRKSHFNSDTWSLACCILYLIFRKHPWHYVSSTQDQQQVVLAIKKSPQDILTYVHYAKDHHLISSRLEDLLLKMLHYDPDQRITAHIALKHPVFTTIGGISTPLSSLTPVESGDVPTVVPTAATDSNPQLEDKSPNQPYVRTHKNQNPVNNVYYAQISDSTNVIAQPRNGALNNPFTYQPPYRYNMAGSTYINSTVKQAFPQASTSDINAAPINQNGELQYLNFSQMKPTPIFDGNNRQQMPKVLPILLQENYKTDYNHGLSSETLPNYTADNGEQLPADIAFYNTTEMLRNQGPLADSSNGHSSSYELPLDLSQHPLRDKVDGSPEARSAEDMLSLGEQLAASSGYNSSITSAPRVSIEVSLNEKVDHFKAAAHSTIGEIWPILKDKARKMISDQRGAVALYEEKRKLDKSHFHEVLNRDRRFTVIIMNE